MEQHYKNVIKALEQFTYKRSLLTVFKDCVHVLALTFALRTDLYRQTERMEDLKQSLERYAETEKEFTAVQNAITNMLKVSSEKFGDHLGYIYMQLVPKSANAQGQVFTPYHIAKLMCEMTFNKDEFDNGKVLKINDPCCGGGVFSIAYCDILNNRKINYTQQAILYSNDIDITCVEMTYLQLSFLGASAVIEHKNTLTLEKWDEFRTLGFLLAHARRHNEKI